jgi:hypothetical protein
LLAVANGTPIILSKVFGKALTLPVDGGAAFADGRPPFGKDDARSRALHLGQLNWEVGVVELVKCDRAPTLSDPNSLTVRLVPPGPEEGVKLRSRWIRGQRA